MHTPLCSQPRVPNCRLETDSKHWLQGAQKRVISTLMMVPLSCFPLLGGRGEGKGRSWKNTFKWISAGQRFAHLFLTGFS